MAERADCRGRVPRRGRLAAAGLLVCTLLAIPQARAQAIPSSGRFSLFSSWSQRNFESGETTDFVELIGTITLRSETTPDGVFEYAIDARVATYPTTDRDQRVSLYEAFVGYRSRDQRWLVRVGQQWIRELGGIGAVGGVFGEYRQTRPSSIGAFRLGLFAGLEPQYYDAGYVNDVTKGGLYLALDGDHGRRHVLGWANIRNSGLTERSVVVFNNFIPAGRKLFFYQALEYDLEGPAGLGDAELSYLFLNLRYSPIRWLELQGTYHNGRSIDVRSITEDHLAGRPVDPAALDGFLFESSRFRLTLRPLRRLAVWGGYGRDRNNRGEAARDRVQLGFSTNDILGAGLDFTATSSSYSSEEDSYDALYLSLGKTVGRRVYLSLDYTDTLAVYRYLDSDGGSVEVRPDSQRFALSTNVNLNRTFSLLATLESLELDADDERRLLLGLIVRF